MEKFIGKSEDLYEVLGLPPRGDKENKAITLEIITKAYRKCALSCHPDKTESKDDLKRFHKISSAYSVLKSDSARKVYDTTGKFSVENQPLTSRQQDWTNLFRAMYDEVSEAEVKSFYETYAGSKEEIVDLIDGFKKTKGDFAELIFSYALFDNAKKGHVRRIKGILDTLIKNKKIRKNARYDATSGDASLVMIEETLLKERDLATLEASHMKSQGSKTMVQKGKKSSSVTDLQVALMSNSKRMDDFVNALAAKYEEKEPKKRKRQKF